jgi:hypothetical protein
MIMHWWELLAIILGSGIVSAFLVFFLISRFLTSGASAIHEYIKLYFNALDNDGISQFGHAVDAVGKSLASNILGTIKAAQMGEASGEAKREKLVERAIAEDQLTDMNPLLAMATQSIPSLKKLFNKNPLTLLTAANMFKGGGLGLKAKGPSNGGFKNISKIGG